MSVTGCKPLPAAREYVRGKAGCPTISPPSFLLHSRQGFFDALPSMEPLPQDEIERAVKLALTEDVGSGDVTTLATISESARACAVMIAREPLVLAGLDLAEAAFRESSPEVRCERRI